jgi:hypothetical protein
MFKNLFTLLTALLLTTNAFGAQSAINYGNDGVTAVVASNDSNLEAYTPIFTGFGTVTNVAFYKKRLGDLLLIEGKFTSGTTTATEARISLPSGLTSAGTDIIPSIRKAGTFIQSIPSASQLVALIEPSVTYLTFGLQDASNAGLTKKNGDDMFSSSTDFSFSALVPIEGWVTGNAAIGPRSIATAYDTSGHGSTATTTLIFNNTSVVGPAISITSDSTDATRFNILENGVYCTSLVGYHSSASSIGITVDTPSASTSVATLATNSPPTGVLNSINAAANLPSLVSWCGPLVVGNVLRAQTSGATATSDNRIKMVVTKVSN